MMHFPPVSDFPPVSEKFLDFQKNVKNVTFSRKISRLSSAEISDDLFFSHRPQILNFPPIFAVSVHFPPVLQKLLFPPTLTNFPLCFTQIHLLFTYFAWYFVSPYFYHDAFMHHPMHVLDASVYKVCHKPDVLNEI